MALCRNDEADLVVLLGLHKNIFYYLTQVIKAFGKKYPIGVSGFLKHTRADGAQFITTL